MNRIKVKALKSGMILNFEFLILPCTKECGISRTIVLNLFVLHLPKINKKIEIQKLIKIKNSYKLIELIKTK